MAPVRQELEINLAQRLASNEKSIRSKALKTLRKYINLRSQKIEGGFTTDDLLKIWKGLFYCLWMQDKPLLQEEISHTISGLIHSFQTTDSQLLYFATFLQTVKREWNGIDRLRMDKFFQLVRFMFRQAFEILKRREWESSLVNHFLQVFTKQLLQNNEYVPKGLMLHILDLYMNELAQVGSTELTAEQNLIFIDPFCKTMAKTKDRLLLNYISKNIFRTIVDHAPYAIEDLIKELQHAEGDYSESDMSSEVEEEERIEEEALKNKPKETKVKTVDGTPEDLDSMGSEENDVGPVLQFDYGALADHLFELSSRSNTRNRRMMYSLVKIFRDLSAGISPQIKNDNCDLSDGSNKLLNNKKSKKKKKRRINESPATGDKMVAKKSKGACQDEKPSVLLSNTPENFKKTEKGFEENIEPTDAYKAMDTSHISLEAGGTPKEQNVRKKRVVDSQLKFSEIEADGETMSGCMKSDSRHQFEAGISFKKERSKALKTKLKNVGEELTHGFQLTLEEPDSCVTLMKRKRRCAQTSTDINALGQSCANHKPEITSLVESPVETQQAKCGISVSQEKTKKKKKKMMNVVEEKTDTEISGLILDKTSQEISLHSQLETSAVAFHKEHYARNAFRKLSTPEKDDKDNSAAQTQLGTSATQKKKGRSKKLKHSSHTEGKEVEYTLQDCCVAKDILTPAAKVINVEAQPSETVMWKKKIKKRRAEDKIGNKLQVDLDVNEPQMSSNSKHITIHENKGHTSECSQPKSVKNAKKSKHTISNLEDFEDKQKQSATPSKNNKIQKKQDILPVEKPKKNIIQKAVNEHAETVPDHAPQMNSLTLVKIGKKKRKLQTNEAEMSQNNEPVWNKIGEKKSKISGIVTPKKLKMGKASPKTDFVSFQGLIKPPTPLFCKTKPKHSIKKTEKKKTENKKVTFGLKNNITTEFRKTDRSLLVSPVGSSRVAFDPNKLPMSGVLKSPSLSPVLRVKNKPAAKKRATAADFF